MIAEASQEVGWLAPAPDNGAVAALWTGDWSTTPVANPKRTLDRILSMSIAVFGGYAISVNSPMAFVFNEQRRAAGLGPWLYTDRIGAMFNNIVVPNEDFERVARILMCTVFYKGTPSTKEIGDMVLLGGCIREYATAAVSSGRISETTKQAIVDSVVVDSIRYPDFGESPTAVIANASFVGQLFDRLLEITQSNRRAFRPKFGITTTGVRAEERVARWLVNVALRVAGHDVVDAKPHLNPTVEEIFD